jgi:hypothetical protein
MDFVVITVSNLIWIIYCLTEGVREGFFNHYKSTYRNSLRYNFKKMFLIQRLLVLSATGGIMLHTIGLIALPFVIGQLLMFHFLHKMAYSCTVNKIELLKTERLTENKIVEKVKDPLLILGVTLQIFIYLFFM